MSIRKWGRHTKAKHLIRGMECDASMMEIKSTKYL